MLVHLPVGLQVDTLLRALPTIFWERGYDAQPWTQLQDTELVIPRFTMILDLIDFPVCMWKEEAVKRAVAGIGVFLGSVPPPLVSDYSCWRVAIATPDLRRVPKQVGLVIGGIEHVSQIMPVIWEGGPVYKPADFPEQPIKYPPPPPPEKSLSGEQDNMSTDGSSEASAQDGDDLIYCSRRAMLEICRGLKLDDIPLEIRRIITGRKGHGEVPLEVLRNMVDDAVFIARSADKIVDHEAGRLGTIDQSAIRMDIHRDHNESETPDISAIFADNQTGELCETGCNMTAEEQPQGTASDSEPRQPTNGGKDKPSVTSEKGQCSNGGNISVAGRSDNRTGHEVEFSKTHGEQIPQKIPQKAKEGGPTKNQQRAHAFSRNMRFREIMDKKKFKTRAEKPVVRGRSNEMDQRAQVGPHKPQNGPRVQRAKGQGITIGNDLVNVPIQLLKDPLQSLPAPQRKEKNKGPMTPSKRKNTDRIPDLNSKVKKAATRKKVQGKAELNLSPSGFFEIHVDETQIAAIGKGCAVETKEVINALHRDNEERKEAVAAEKLKANIGEDTWDERFQLDPEDDLEDIEDIDIDNLNFDDLDTEELADLDLTKDLLMEDQV